MTEYAELAVATNFSFLRGASHAEELVETAKALGLSAIGVADRNTFAGVVRAHVAAKEFGMRLVVGTRLVTEDGFEVLAYPQDRAAFGRLCRLLTRGNRRAKKGQCHLGLRDVLEFSEGQIFIAMPPEKLTPAFRDSLENLSRHAPARTYLSASWLYGARNAKRLAQLDALGSVANAPLLATNDVHYHTPERQILQDVLTCIREKTTIAEAGFRLAANAERHLKPPAEMARLFARYPQAIARAQEILSRITFSLDQLSYDYPDEIKGGSATPQEELERLTWIGADHFYPQGIPEKVRALLIHELSLIGQLHYAPYFLTVWDLVRFAKEKGILAQGRGSAANSAVCYVLGITAVDPARMDLLFERFVSAERGEPPDIDVDFEHERREEVIQYIYARYGRARAGLAATVISYRAKSAIRDVGKAMGLSVDVVGALAGNLGWWDGKGFSPVRLKEIGLDPADPTLAKTVVLAHELHGFPRHLSQHVGGFVITSGALEALVPIGNAAMPDRTFVEWDKDDLDALNILKVDVLALGMLTAIAKAFVLLETHYGKRLTLTSVPPEDPAVYEMLSRADSVGVFQVESRAQMSMLPRLKPKEFFDLVIEVAIVRPGPIQGDMVHPYLKRREGIEPVSYPTKELEAVLHRTLGVPLFQEQCMQIAIVGAGFTPAEADKLRRAMATFRRMGTIHTFREKFIAGMLARGYEQDFAERCFRQMEGFGEYGFPLSHAASFALLVYISAWIKCHYPDVFCAAILNAQPMGFYAPAQLVRDARDHGVTVLPPDINASLWDHTLEKAEGRFYAVRLGFRLIKGFRQEDAETLIGARQNGYDSVRHLALATALSPAVLERLAEADAFRSVGLDRRAALWAVKGLDGRSAATKEALLPLPLFAPAGAAVRGPEAAVALPPLRLGEHVVQDYASLSLSLKAHPLALLRTRIAARGITPCTGLSEARDGSRLTVAGLVLVRQRPGTAQGVIFATLEDETGIANVIVWPKVFEAQRRTLLAARLLAVRGKLQRQGLVIHIIAERLEDLSSELALLAADRPPEISILAHADQVKHGSEERPNHGRGAPRAQSHSLGKSRDFR
jgi:error-prone DNA polymerase